MLLADAWSKRSWTQRTDQLYIAKMQGSSGDTRFTFNDDPVAPAEEASQTSPGTAESGSKSTMSRTTMSGWNMPGQRRRATASTLRSARDGEPRPSAPLSAICTTPATQNDGRCECVPRLPRQMPVDVSMCRACHAKCRGATGA